MGLEAPKRALARRMRANPVSAEELLWRILRDRRLDGLKFRRQLPIGRYVADFVSLRHRLIVEADGPFHDAARDAVRDGWLQSRGFRVLRFDNDAIHESPDIVREAIRAALAVPDADLDWTLSAIEPYLDAALPPSPHEGEGGGRSPPGEGSR
jgi:very-short-patch-repair endonuclease